MKINIRYNEGFQCEIVVDTFLPLWSRRVFSKYVKHVNFWNVFEKTNGLVVVVFENTNGSRPGSSFKG